MNMTHGWSVYHVLQLATFAAKKSFHSGEFNKRTFKGLKASVYTARAYELKENRTD